MKAVWGSKALTATVIPHIPMSSSPSVAVAHRALLKIRRIQEEDTQEESDGFDDSSNRPRLHPSPDRHE